MNGGTQGEVAAIKARLADEIARFDPERHGHGIASWNRAILADFEAALIEPEETEVHLPGGVSDWAWAVTRHKGPYRVLWLPWANAFSLAVESRFGPVDIQVHGDAIGCFSSV
ncbi:hypothetical protein [Sinisalibacter aestuarii]|uniref:Uncharacterized protein n=1 Tax=Sinisalibacter aestuarii TaxID=2949426 RepID=A0ABQ5LNR4_9RHOB|nr:hypothetical protein [Sinisalibacter aestuarii]GKY86645.1 hypothetical protein STA1M1_05140 [Sinisalibacter aestuarii]